MRETDQKLLRRELAIARKAIPSCDWSAIADLIALDRRAWDRQFDKPDDELNRDLEPGLEKLRSEGYVVHPMRLGGEKIAAIRKHLEGLPVLNGYHPYATNPHDPLMSLEEARSRSAFAGYTMDQLLRTPHLVDFLNQPAIIDFVQLALGCVPTLYSLNAWWSFPASSATGDGAQYFHRDNDDWRFITLFVYLTDVDKSSGPHQMIAGSHTLDGLNGLLKRAQAKRPVSFDVVDSFTSDHYFGSGFSASCESLFGDAIVDIVGPAGTMFMANTIAIHRGLTPREKPRLVLWARYGLGPNTNSVDLEQGPLARFQVKAELPDTPRNRYVNRLLFEFDRFPTLVPDPVREADSVLNGVSQAPQVLASPTSSGGGSLARVIRAASDLLGLPKGSAS